MLGVIPVRLRWIRNLFLLHRNERLEEELLTLRDQNEADMVDLCMRYPKDADNILKYVRGEMSEDAFERIIQ